MVYSISKDIGYIEIYARQNGHLKKRYYIEGEDFKKIETILFLKGINPELIANRPRVKVWKEVPEYDLPKHIYKVIKPYLVRY
jgi:hypothetical protein